MRRLLAFALPLLLAMGGTSSALADPSSLERISRASPFNAKCGGPAAGGTVFINAEVEPWVSANPEDDRQPRRRLAAGPLVQRRRPGQPDRRLVRPRPARGRARRRRRSAAARAATPPTWRLRPRVRPVGELRRRRLRPPDRPGHQRRPDDQRHPRLQLARRRPHLGPDHDAPARHDRRAVQRQGVDHGRSEERPVRLRGLGPPAGREPGQPAVAVLGRHAVRPLDRRRPDLGATRTILNFPDNSNIQTLGNQIVVLSDGTLVNTFDLIDRGLPLVAVQRSTDRGVDVVGADHRRRAVQQRHAGSGRRRSIRRRTRCAPATCS